MWLRSVVTFAFGTRSCKQLVRQIRGNGQNGDIRVLKKIQAAIAALVITAGAAQAHEFWLDPVQFSPGVGARVPIVFRNGMNFLGDSYPFVRAWSKRFSVFDGKGERQIKAVQGDDPAAEVLFPNAGLAAVVFERAPDRVTYKTVEHLLETLDDEGLEVIAAQYRAMKDPPNTVTESYARFAKTLLNVGPNVGSGASLAASTGADRAVGLAMEIVVETNPYLLAKDAPLVARVLQGGKPVVDAQVKAFNRADPVSPRRVRTDADGRVVFNGLMAGETMLSAVVMSPGDPKARDVKDRNDWISLWASVTFKRP